MLRLLAVLAVFIASVRAEDPFREVHSIVRQLSEITKLPELRRVRYATLDRAGLRRYLDERVKRVTKPAEIRAEELTLKKFGLVPANFDLARSTVDLMAEQAAAFYDDSTKKLYLLSDGGGSLQPMVLAHELSHALADQHFHLNRFLRDRSKSDDSSLARLAVVEGQATWLMTEFMAQRTGRSLRRDPELLAPIAAMEQSAAGQYAEFDKSPLYLRELLIFPYLRGALFQQKVLEQEGDAGFRGVFSRPPTSTHQVLHPEAYFAGQEPSLPDVPVLPHVPGYKLLTAGTVGEFDHAVLLRQYGDESTPGKIAAEWRGGSFELWEDRKKTHTILSYASDWATAAAASNFFAQYRRILRSKWKRFEVLEEGEEFVHGRGDDGYFSLRRQDTRVTSMEGLPEPFAAAARPSQSQLH